MRGMWQGVYLKCNPRNNNHCCACGGELTVITKQLMSQELPQSDKTVVIGTTTYVVDAKSKHASEMSRASRANEVSAKLASGELGSLL